MRYITVSTDLREQTLTRDNHRCTYCGATPPDDGLFVDPMIPLSKGGTRELDNLTTTCAMCHAGKGGTIAIPPNREIH